MLLLPPGVSADVLAGGQTLQIAPDSLVIVPPGASTTTAIDHGFIARIFSSRAHPFADLASNAAAYANGAPEVAPLIDGPVHANIMRLNVYPLDCEARGRVFRSTNLMVNVFERKTVRRDARRLSPHSHENFEQIVLTLAGNFVYHLRTPWTADSTAW
ncbi:hypothetical protein LJR034_008491 [Caballeronia sp. LjRoot34]|uniref:hypothetical protein n=1 Tax=Caballeronia sp. LjRoot34 TaxID=3342325 RepID=UPI003ED1471B